MADDKVSVPPDPARIMRLRRAIELASEGAFEEAAGLLESAADGEWGEIELDLQTFITELKVAIQQSDLALNDLIVSKSELQLKLSTIERQRATIRQLSSPIIDVWEGVITVPLIGRLEDGRLEDLRERLLSRITRKGTRWVVLDLTGVELVDSSRASELINVARAVQLMGAKCLLTGIRPQIARSLLEIGVDLDKVRSMGTVQQALEFCIATRR